MINCKRYLQNKIKLAEIIRKDKVNVSETILGKSYMCYFCRCPIKGNAKILNLGENLYEEISFVQLPLDEFCYNMAKVYTFYDMIPLGVN